MNIYMNCTIASIALQVVSKLYQSPHFQPAREAVLGSLLCMLLSRCYTAAQNDLVDTLFRWGLKGGVYD